MTESENAQYEYHELALPSNVKLPDSSCESAIHLNARSACNKEDDIVLFLDQFSFSFDIVMLSETWYSNDCKMLNMEGYNTFF